MRIPYLKWAVFFLAVVLLEQFVFKFISQDVLPSLGDKKVMAALSALTAGDEPTWDSLDDEIRIPIERKGGVWIAKVEINNLYEANLVLDSGASFTTLSEDMAFEVGLSQDINLPMLTIATANGNAKSWIAQVDSIRIGDAERTNVIVHVGDLSNVAKLDIHGLLGMNFLDGFTWRLDHQNEYLLLKPKSS